MASLWMEWGCDLKKSPAGGLSLATGADSTNQIIIRELLTTSNVLLDNGVQATPELYIDPTFGRSLRILVGQNATPDFVSRLKQEITSTVLSTPGVNPNAPPVIQVTEIGNQSLILASYELSNGQPASVAFQIASATT